ncbi:FtsX-like permease family protein [Deinococcus sp.]|uniref:ABC transporter permease n=1 Tax=Deinococcus sp. TaxID=47478 RepID=UPI002600AD50|nr:FtsX-like permease family protein [Deinococcus sp.]
MLSSVWKSLRARPTRTVIALLQALVGALVVTLALALAFTQNRAANTSSDLTLLTAGFSTKTGSTSFSLFVPADLPKFQKLAPDVLKLDLLGYDFIDNLAVGQNRYKLSDSKATGPDYAAITGLKVLHGSYFNAQDVEKGRKVVVIAANTALALFGREDAVGETLSIIGGGGGPDSGKPLPYRVVGVTEAARPNQQGIASPLIRPVAQTVGNKASSVLMVARPGRLAQAKEQLLAAARRSYKNDSQLKSFTTGGKSGFFYSSVTNPMGMPSNTNSTMLRAYYTIAALTLIVSSLGVLSALLVSVNERTRELGLRRAIGATRGQIGVSLLLETGLTTLLGSLVGTGLALLLSPTLAGLFATLLNGVTLEITPTLAVTVIGLFVGLSLLFGLLPAVASTRMRPTEALRVQG